MSKKSMLCKDSNILKYNEADHFRNILGVQLPDNMAIYAGTYYSNIQLNICNTDAINGYGHYITKDLQIMRPYKKCTRCGYHSLWNPDDSESQCMRHTLVSGWDTVFSYKFGCKMSMEHAFQIFLDKQTEDWRFPVVPYHAE